VFFTRLSNTFTQLPLTNDKSIERATLLFDLQAIITVKVLWEREVERKRGYTRSKKGLVGYMVVGNKYEQPRFILITSRVSICQL